MKLNEIFVCIWLGNLKKETMTMEAKDIKGNNESVFFWKCE